MAWTKHTQLLSVVLGSVPPVREENLLETFPCAAEKDRGVLTYEHDVCPREHLGTWWGGDPVHHAVSTVSTTGSRRLSFTPSQLVLVSVEGRINIPISTATR